MNFRYKKEHFYQKNIPSEEDYTVIEDDNHDINEKKKKIIIYLKIILIYLI